MAADEVALQPMIRNPAAVYCLDLGYEYQIVNDDEQQGICMLPDGQACDAWEFLQGKCGQAASYCARHGYETRTVADGQDPFSPEYAVCISDEGRVVGSVVELSNLEEKSTGCEGETPGGALPPLLVGGEPYVPSGIDAPPSFDWRNFEGADWLTPIKDQGQCGSCWAFSAVGVAEAAHNIAGDDPDLDKDLSEQYLVSDCHNLSGYQTCCGGWKDIALEYIRDEGIPDEDCMPYVDGVGCSCSGGTCDTNCMYREEGDCSDTTCSDRCADWSSRREFIVTTGDVWSDPDVIKQAMVDVGPLAVSIGIGGSFGGYWDGDIYRCSDDWGANHAVSIVGYDDVGGYWWVRNSWGAGWGDHGYYKLGYGECYVEQSVVYADAHSSGVGPLSYYSHLLDDDDMGQSAGDGDGVADCGETIELYATLQNEGSSTATQVDGVISTTDPYVTWLYNTSSSYPDIFGGGIATNQNDYEFLLDAAAPDGHVIQFDLVITAWNGGPWVDSFEVPVTCINTPPYTPGNPSPADGASDVSITTDLSWSGGDPDPGDPVTYDVYFGTANPPTELVCDDVSDTTCDPGDLDYETQYYWYVEATDSRDASAEGPIWNLTTLGGDAYEEDDTSEQANWIEDGSPQAHSIVPVGDVDWVKFTLTVESAVVLETSGESGNTHMWLYDSSLNQLEYDDDGGSDLFSRIDRLCDVDALAAGTYYALVREFGDDDAILDYDLTFTVSQVCPKRFLIYLPLVQKKSP